MHTVGPGVWRETLKIMEYQKKTLDDLKNDEISEKREK
jgi:hypothetical protein